MMSVLKIHFLVGSWRRYAAGKTTYPLIEN
jgi:hypothetical protein